MSQLQIGTAIRKICEFLISECDFKILNDPVIKERIVVLALSDPFWIQHIKDMIHQPKNFFDHCTKLFDGIEWIGCSFQYTCSDTVFDHIKRIIEN